LSQAYKEDKGKVLYFNFRTLKMYSTEESGQSFEYKKFSLDSQPQHFNFIDYKMDGFRAFYCTSFDRS